MKEFGWFGLVTGLLGIAAIFSSSYEWDWFWRWTDRGGALKLLDRIGWEKTRLLYLVLGFSTLGVSTASVILWVSAIKSLSAFLIGFACSVVVTKLIYESREGQSISELIPLKAKRKPKPKHEEED